MDAQEFFNTKVKIAKDFGFPEPIFINAIKLTKRNRVIYIVEIQSIFIPNPKTGKTHHYSLKFSKFRKTKEEPNWEEENIVSHSGFTIADHASLEKLAGYIKANEALLNIDILSKSYTSAFLTNDVTTIELIKQILKSEKNKEAIYDLFKEQYPELDKKILIYKLIEARRKALEEFTSSLADTDKNERNYWQPFLEKNRWMFGLSYFIMIKDPRIDQWDTADFLFEADDGFIDIVEIKHPHLEFWDKDSHGNHKKYRDFIQYSEELKGSITQSTNYIFQVEKKYSDPEWCSKNNVETPVKPKCTIIFGRSNEWNIEEKTAFRLLNDSLHGIEIITFDHLLNRASKVLYSLEKEGN